jgi:hypothetical protein
MHEPDIDLGKPLLIDELTPAYFQERKYRREMVRADALSRTRVLRHVRYNNKSITDGLISKVWPMSSAMKGALATMGIIIFVMAAVSYLWLNSNIRLFEGW